MFNKLENLLKEYRNLEKELILGIGNSQKLQDTLKRISDLKKIVETYSIYKDKIKELDDLNKLLKEEKDKELINLAKLEINNLEKETLKLKKELEILLIPKDPNDDKNVIVEIKGGAGGDESNIFVGDLFRMYSKYCDSKGWKITVANSYPSDTGGFSNIEFFISGKEVYKNLKYESGVHRVQRVPETESQGRIHTSTVSVLVFPEREEVEVNLNWNDIRVDTYASSGPGGQSVNTTMSAVRLTHIPTNTVVQCQDGKSQHENKAQAFKILNARVYDKILEKQESKEAKERKELVRSADRAEKIRTYNYPQNRVTDHRISLTLNRLDQIIEGNLDIVITPLIEELNLKKLKK